MHPSFDISIVEGIADSTWYSLDNGISNNSFTGTTGVINETAWYDLQDGTVKITFYVNDSKGYIGKAEVSIIKTIASPEITIISPTLNQKIGAQAPEFTITVTDLSSIVSMWYTIDTGINNFTFTGFTGTINSTAWEVALEGKIYLTFYAKDDLGNIGRETVIIIKRISSEITIPGYFIHFILVVSSLVSVFILKKKIRYS